MTDLANLATRAVPAVMGTCGVSVLIKLIDSYFRYREKTADVPHQFRDELHARVGELLAQVKALQTDLDAWKGKYYDTYQALVLLRARHTALCLRFEETTGQAPPADEGPEPREQPPAKS